MWMYFKIQFICEVAKQNFQQPLLQSSVSHDPSEIILICWFDSQEAFIILNVENSLLLWKLSYIFILWFFDE